MSTIPLQATTIIFGLGKTGWSCAQFLHARGFDFAVVDTREHPPGLDRLRREYPQVKFLGGVTSSSSIGRCERVLLSPGVAATHPIIQALRARGVSVIGDVELFGEYAQAPVIAVTGSNGKSTVVSLLTAILQAAGRDVRTGGNIGIPALDLIADHEPDCYVLELSSFQLETTAKFAPSIACILNVSPDHLDRYATFADYIAAKARIYARASHLVLNADDLGLRELQPECPVSYVSGAANSNAQFHLEVCAAQTWLIANGERVLRTDELALRGEHNRLNALAALALVAHLDVSIEVVQHVMRTFRGLAHRCQSVAQIEGVEWIDDSKGTNPGASCAAIRGVFAERTGVLIAGGQAKGARFDELADAIAGRVHTVVLIGVDAARIAAAIGDRARIHNALDMPSAVNTARQAAHSGEAVLLSPACASFDMFENFEARGKAFATAVAEVAIS